MAAQNRPAGACIDAFNFACRCRYMHNPALHTKQQAPNGRYVDDTHQCKARNPYVQESQKSHPNYRTVFGQR